MTIKTIIKCPHSQETMTRLKKNFTVHADVLSEAQKKRLKLKEDRSLSALIERLLREYCRKPRENPSTTPRA